MRSEPLTVALALACAWTACAQNGSKTGIARRKSAIAIPACAARAICFTGEVAAGREFRKALNTDLEFVVSGGWAISIVPTRPEGDCEDFVSVVNAPYRSHRDLDIDTSYGWTAEQEVSASPREFGFVTNCADNRMEAARLAIVLWPYTATEEKYNEALPNLATSRLGHGRMWITNSTVSHKNDTPKNKLGTIESMRFSVEITLPANE